jgi:hypothetical protein
MRKSSLGFIDPRQCERLPIPGLVRPLARSGSSLAKRLAADQRRVLRFIQSQHCLFSMSSAQFEPAPQSCLIWFCLFPRLTEKTLGKRSDDLEQKEYSSPGKLASITFLGGE